MVGDGGCIEGARGGCRRHSFPPQPLHTSFSPPPTPTHPHSPPPHPLTPPSAAGEGGAPGFIGNVAYSQRNLFGLNQKLTASVEVGQQDALFRVSHLDPWIEGDPHRTSRRV